MPSISPQKVIKERHRLHLSEESFVAQRRRRERSSADVLSQLDALWSRGSEFLISASELMKLKPGCFAGGRG